MTTDFGLVVVGYESDAEWSGFFDSISHSSQVPSSTVIVDNSPTCRMKPVLAGSSR